MLRDMDVRRRLVTLTSVLTVLAAVVAFPALYAAASPAAAAHSLGGTIAGTDIAHHHIGVKVTTGAAKYKGKTVAILLHKTAVTRLGKTVTPAAIKKYDRVTVTYAVNAKTHVVTALKIVDTGPKPKPVPTPSPTPSQTATSYTIHMSNYSFSPPSLTVPVGSTVTVVTDNGTHTWTSGSDGIANGKFDSNGASTFSFTFNTPGTYPYFCQYHYATNQMAGSITVTG